MLIPGSGDRADPELLQRIFRETDIRRKPIAGFVTGYHTLPFTLVGPNDERLDEGVAEDRLGSLMLTGKISVGPKLVVSISRDDDRFGEIFPESEPFMDRSLVGRMFSFSAAYRKNHRIRNEHLRVEAYAEDDRQLLAKVLDECDRAETVDRGVIWCPRPRFYPISLERYIVSVLDRELGR